MIGKSLKYIQSMEMAIELLLHVLRCQSTNRASDPVYTQLLRLYILVATTEWYCKCWLNLPNVVEKSRHLGSEPSKVIVSSNQAGNKCKGCISGQREVWLTKIDCASINQDKSGQAWVHHCSENSSSERSDWSHATDARANFHSDTDSFFFFANYSGYCFFVFFPDVATRYFSGVAPF